MRLHLRRLFFKPTYTIGHLCIEDHYFCDTLEDAVRPHKIKGETAIPAGEYKVTMEYSPRFKRKLPTLHDVPNYSYVRIHSGNTIRDTEGCPLVGENKVKAGLINSRLWSDRVSQLCLDAQMRGESITILIEDCR